MSTLTSIYNHNIFGNIAFVIGSDIVTYYIVMLRVLPTNA